MSQYINEIDESFENFSTNWNQQLATTVISLQASKTVFKESYRRLVALNAWRDIILDHKLDAESIAFFLEAQNDALVSHTLSQFGSWRSALKALRSCIENIVSCLYYKDHLVELKLWHMGKHKLGFTEGIKYLRDHPDLASFDEVQTGIQILVKEYGTLSRAVHASASSFRMTNDASSITLWSSRRDNIGGWKSREVQVMQALNTLLISVYYKELQGTKLPALRQAISLSISRSKYSDIKSTYGVILAYPS